MTHAAPVRVFHLAAPTTVPFLWRPVVIVEDEGPTRGRPVIGHDRAVARARRNALTLIAARITAVGRPAYRLAL